MGALAILEGINQLARFLFLKQAWRHIVGEGDTTWIDRQIKSAEAKPQEPYAEIGLALKTLRALGAKDDDVTDIVRGMRRSFCSDCAAFWMKPTMRSARPRG